MQDLKFRAGLWVIGFALSLAVFIPVIKQGGVLLVIAISAVIGILFAVGLTAKWNEGERP